MSNSNRLVITDRPVAAWFGGLIFCAAGIFIATQGSLLMGAIFGGIGLVVLLLGGFGSQLVIDKDEGAVRLVKYTLVGKQVVRELLIDEVTSAEVRRAGRNTYRIELLLKDGSYQPLTDYSTSGTLSKQVRADKIRNFLGPQKLEDRAAAVLGISGVREQLAQQMYRPRPLDDSPAGAEDSGDTDGVTWEIRRLISPSGGKVTRWFSAGARTGGGFVMLIQGGSDRPGGKGLGGLLGSLANMVYKQFIGMYQIGGDETPGLENAQPVQNLEPRLAQNFASLTDDSYTARQMLNPWAAGPLAEWAARHPAGGIQVMRDNDYGPMFALFSPKGVTIAFASQIDDPAMVEEITRLGVELVKANSS